MSRRFEHCLVPTVLFMAPAVAVMACAAPRPAPPPANPGPAARRPACTGIAEIPIDSSSEITRLSLCVAAASSSREGVGPYGRGRWHNDDRAHVAHGGRALMVADGSGPTYGGYHYPIAIETGFDVLESAFRPSLKVPCTEACVRAAFDVADAAMFSFETAFKPMFEEELAKSPADRLAASKRAWQRVARARLGRSIEDDAHAGASDHCADHRRRQRDGRPDRNRPAYRCRGGTVERLLPDQSLNTDPRLAYGDASYYGAASALLGLGPTATVLTRTVGVQARRPIRALHGRRLERRQ